MGPPINPVRFNQQQSAVEGQEPPAKPEFPNAYASTYQPLPSQPATWGTVAMKGSATTIVISLGSR